MRVLSALAFPEVWPGWRGNALIGDFHRDFLQPGAPVLTALTVMCGDAADGERAFLKSARATQQAGTGIARYLPGLPEKARDWRFLTERLKDGERLVKASYFAAVYAPADAIDEAEQAVRAIYHGQGWRVAAERYVHLPSWLACLPMAPAGGLDADLGRMGRTKTLLTSSAVNLAPIHGEWRGQRPDPGNPPVLFLLGRRGQPAGWSPFANEAGNYNVAVTGKSGSGKSVLMQELVAGLVGAGGEAVVIDDGRSFQHAAEARTLGQHWSTEAATARTAAATDATSMVERYARDVSTGTAHARGVTESESDQAQALRTHTDRLAEIGGITKDQAAVLTGEARIGGGLSSIVTLGAGGAAMWRGQTIESDAWNRMRDYAGQHQVLDLWSRVAEASQRYSAATGESELASLEESFGANLTRMRRFDERASLSFQNSESWSEQAAQVRAEAQAIDRDLGQPFFSWLSEREGAGGRPIGIAGAVRLASPQTPEDAEELRQHAAAFIAERFPRPAGPDPASAGDRSEYDEASVRLGDAYTRETAAAYGGWSASARDRARAAGAPGPGEVEADASAERAATEAGMIVREVRREAKAGITEERLSEGRAGVAVHAERPFAEHATEGLPLIGEWLAGKLYGTAGNEAPDGADGEREDEAGGAPDEVVRRTGRRPPGKDQ